MKVERITKIYNIQNNKKDSPTQKNKPKQKTNTSFESIFQAVLNKK